MAEGELAEQVQAGVDAVDLVAVDAAVDEHRHAQIAALREHGLAAPGSWSCSWTNLSQRALAAGEAHGLWTVTSYIGRPPAERPNLADRDACALPVDLLEDTAELRVGGEALVRVALPRLRPLRPWAPGPRRASPAECLRRRGGWSLPRRSWRPPRRRRRPRRSRAGRGRASGRAVWGSATVSRRRTSSELADELHDPAMRGMHAHARLVVHHGAMAGDDLVKAGASPPPRAPPVCQSSGGSRSA